MSIATAIILLASSLCLIAGAFLDNHLHPSYGSALAVPIANFISVVLAVTGTVISFVAYRRRNSAPAVRRTLMVGLVWTMALLILLPLTNMGYFSQVH